MAQDALGLARQQAAAMYEADRASQAAGITVDEVAPGRATLRMTVGPAMINGHQICHGGYIFLLADTAFAFACNTHGPAAVAQACEITYLQPARLGDVLVASATERARSGRSGLYDVTVRSHADVVAEFRGHARTVSALRGEAG